MACGPSIHALGVLNLQRGDWVTRINFAGESALVLIWGTLISVVLLRLRPWPTTLVAPATFCAFALIAIYVQARWHLWFSWLVPAGGQTSVACICSVGLPDRVEYGLRQRIGS